MSQLVFEIFAHSKFFPCPLPLFILQEVQGAGGLIGPQMQLQTPWKEKLGVGKRVFHVFSY
jgi:hypothetical protein